MRGRQVSGIMVKDKGHNKVKGIGVRVVRQLLSLCHVTCLLTAGIGSSLSHPYQVSLLLSTVSALASLIITRQLKSACSQVLVCSLSGFSVL